jgi:DNA modification methylase
MSPKEWVKAQIGVWRVFYEKRDIRDKDVHPAVMPIALARRAVELFTHKGELVVDPFAGVGTSLVACQDVGRNAVGFDINPQYCDQARQRIDRGDATYGEQQVVVCDDARRAAAYLADGTVSLIFTSPPYANLLNRPRSNKSRRGELRRNKQYLKVEQYSQDEKDLGTLGVKEYGAQMMKIFRGLFPVLKTKGHVVINVPDMWWKNDRGGERVPLHVHVYLALVEAGYELRNTIIWDRTNIVNRVGIFGWPSNYITMGTTFEYLLDFWKPALT